MFSDGDPLRFRGEVYHPYHFSCTGCKEELTATARFAFACFNLLTFLHDVYKCIFVNAFQLRCLFCFHLDLDCLHCLSEPNQGGADPPRLHGQRAERALLPSLPRQDGNSHLRRLQVCSSLLVVKTCLLTQNLQTSDRGESGDCSWEALACRTLCLRQGFNFIS